MIIFANEKTLPLHSAAVPRVRLEPEQQIVRPGDSPWIRCEVTQVSCHWPSAVT